MFGQGGKVQDRIPNLDGLRAVAVMLVIVAHAKDTEGIGDWRPILDSMPDASLGVRVFFVLSGFIITQLLLREEARTGTVDLPHFFWRRAFRLLPPLLLYLGVLAAYTMVTDASEPALSWLTSLTFTKNFYATTWYTGHLWSLAVEEQFYLIWPFVFVFATRWGRSRVALAAILAALAARFLLLAMGRDGFAAVSPVTNMDFVMAGVLVALLIPKLDSAKLERREVSGGLIVASAVMIALVAALGPSESIVANALRPSLLVAAIAVGLLAVLFIRTGPIAVILNAKPVVYIGRISYGLYLWQQLFLAPEGYDDPLSFVLPLPVALLLILAVSVASFELLEEPLLRRRNSLLERLRRPHWRRRALATASKT